MSFHCYFSVRFKGIWCPRKGQNVRVWGLNSVMSSVGFPHFKLNKEVVSTPFNCINMMSNSMQEGRNKEEILSELSRKMSKVSE